MDQLFETELTDFEQATVEQLVSYRIAQKDGETDEEVNARIEKLCQSEALKSEAMQLVAKWNKQRIDKGLKPFR